MSLMTLAFVLGIIACVLLAYAYFAPASAPPRTKQVAYGLIAVAVGLALFVRLG